MGNVSNWTTIFLVLRLKEEDKMGICGQLSHSATCSILAMLCSLIAFMCAEPGRTSPVYAFAGLGDYATLLANLAISQKVLIHSMATHLALSLIF